VRLEEERRPSYILYIPYIPNNPPLAVRKCLPSEILSSVGLSCDTNREGIIAFDNNLAPASIVLVPTEDKFIVPCEVARLGFAALCKCDIPDNLVGHSSYSLHSQCEEIPLPKNGPSAIGNGYFNPTGLYANYEKGLLFVADALYSRVLVFNLYGTSSFISRLETKSGYLSYPVSVASRPGVAPLHSTFSVPDSITVGVMTSFSLTLKNDSNDDAFSAAVLLTESSSTLFELSTIKMTAVGSVVIGSEAVNLETLGGQVTIADDGTPSLSIKLTQAGNYSLSVYQMLRPGGSTLHFHGSPSTITVYPSESMLSPAYSQYMTPEYAPKAGVSFSISMTPRDIFLNPTINSPLAEEFYGRIITENGKNTVQFRTNSEVQADEDFKPGKKPDSDSIVNYSNYMQAVMTVTQAGSWSFAVSKDGPKGTFTQINKVDILPADPEISKSKFRVNNHYMSSEVIQALTYESASSDVTFNFCCRTTR